MSGRQTDYQDRSAIAVNKHLDKPQPPAPNECCENGCEACVWDIYQEALDEWKDQQKTLKKTDTFKSSTD